MKVWVGDVPLKVCVCVHTQAHMCEHTQTHTHGPTLSISPAAQGLLSVHIPLEMPGKPSPSTACMLHPGFLPVQEGGTEPHMWKYLQPHG